jgi:alkylated DNA repair dioxygenase AlkB
VSFGYRYDYAGHALRESELMPDFLEPLIDIVSRFSGIAASSRQQAMVTEYAPGAGIGWHRDKLRSGSALVACALRPTIAQKGRPIVNT